LNAARPAANRSLKKGSLRRLHVSLDPPSKLIGVDVDGRVGESDLLLRRQQAVAVIGMDVGDDDRIDGGGIDASGGQRLRHLAGHRTSAGGIAGVDEHQLVASVDQPFVERGRRHVSRHERGFHQLRDAGWVAGEEFGRQRSGPVVEHGDFHSPDLDAVHAGSLRARGWCLGGGRESRKQRAANGGQTERASGQRHVHPP